MQPKLAAALTAAGLILAQLNTPGSYNLGIPAVPGTRIPESNPATSIVVAPPAPAPGGMSASPAAAGAASGVSEGPAYSFGSAPPPTTSSAR